MEENKNDFLLITPLRVVAYPLEPALWPLHLYTYSTRNGFNGEMIDFNTIIYENDISDYDSIVYDTIEKWLLSNPETKIIGITCLFSAIFERVLEIAKIIKKIRKDSIVVIGGNHATVFHEEIIKNAFDIDYVVMGEGEEQFLSILKLHTTDHFIPESNLENGIAYRDDLGNVKISIKSGYIDDLNSLGLLRYDKVDWPKYYTPDLENFYNPKKHEIIAAAPIATSRACPFKCNFCSMYAVMGRKFRPKDNAMVMEEIKVLYYEHNIRYFRIIDDCSTFNKRLSMELFGEIAASDMEISFEFYNGLSIRTLDEEIIDVLVEAGLLRGSLAIESGSEWLRNEIMNKKLKDDEIYEVYEYFDKKYPHVWLIGLFIVGLPEESVETLEETIKMIKNLKNIWPVLNIIVPYPGTEVYEQCIRDDLFTIETKDLWKKALSANPPTLNLADKGLSTDWCAMQEKSISETFLVKPYNLSLEQLSEYYIRLLKLKKQSWKRIEKRKEIAIKQFEGSINHSNTVAA